MEAQRSGPSPHRRNAAHYTASEQRGYINGRSYRLVVDRSDHVDERNAKTQRPDVVDAFFLHRPERVEGLGYMLLMACLLFSLPECPVRRAGEPPADTLSR